MTELMQAIYDQICESRYTEFLPREYYWHYTRLLERQEDDLQKTLTDEQKDLLEKYESTQGQMQLHELEAMFQAAWAAARELG